MSSENCFKMCLFLYKVGKQYCFSQDSAAGKDYIQRANFETGLNKILHNIQIYFSLL